MPPEGALGFRLMVQEEKVSPSSTDVGQSEIVAAGVGVCAIVGDVKKRAREKAPRRAKVARRRAKLPLFELLRRMYFSYARPVCVA